MTQRLAIVVTVINLVVLALTVMQTGSATGQSVAGTLRGRAFELVDERGVVRARLAVKEPTSVVELDLFDKKGIIHVKLGTGETGSGLVLTDEGAESASRSYVQILARRTGTTEFPKTTSITLHATDGRERVITP
jgi:hypothetical protein